LIAWDENDDDDDDKNYVQKYKIVNINDNKKPEILHNYKIENKYASSGKQENSNIFISNRNKAKFGIKF
jgi:hypothetical protein